jgi:hypothetical protein
MISSDLTLIDEAYMQVVRQTRNQPSAEIAYRMWELLLVLTTFFMATPIMQPFVRQYLASVALGKAQTICPIGQLCYLRFCARCHAQTHLKAMSPEFVEQIPRHVHECAFVMGASLYELMWRQRLTAPSCPVPLILHRMCQGLINCGALEIQGIFHIVINKSKLENLGNYIDCGHDMLSAIDPAGLVSMFRKWLSELPHAIIAPEIYPKLSETKANPAAFMQAVDELPNIYRDCLAYLVGFLRVVIAAEHKTKMGVASLAMLFGSSCMKIDTIDGKRIRAAGGLARDLMKYLIESWDVSSVYPVDPGVLPQSFPSS